MRGLTRALIGVMTLVVAAGVAARYWGIGWVFKTGPGVARYVNCATGDDADSGTTPRRAWRSLARVNALTLQPGDSVLLARGTTCHGQLAPKGSGAPDAPITLADYGNGELPLVDG